MTIIWIIAGIIVLFGIVVFRGAPYVPSHRKYVRLAFTKLYHLKPDDVLVDLGSGDGTVLRIAASKGATAIGYELNPLLVVISQILARGDKRQQTRIGDMWLVKIPEETTVVYVFGVNRDSKRLTKKLQTHVNTTGEDLWCITYGAGLDGEPVRKLHAHSLYLLQPATLHTVKP